jgi:hypothetical protein
MSVVATPPPGMGALTLPVMVGAQAYGANESVQPGISGELPTKSGKVEAGGVELAGEADGV